MYITLSLVLDALVFIFIPTTLYLSSLSGRRHLRTPFSSPSSCLTLFPLLILTIDSTLKKLTTTDIEYTIHPIDFPNPFVLFICVPFYTPPWYFF
jgi:hypothetical protein